MGVTFNKTEDVKFEHELLGLYGREGIFSRIKVKAWNEKKHLPCWYFGVQTLPDLTLLLVTQPQT